MNFVNFLSRINSKPLCILPDAHKALVANANLAISNSALDELFEVAPVYTEKGKLAIINVAGVILPKASKFERLLGAAGCKDIRAAVKTALKSPTVENVLFVFDSPGGISDGIYEAADAIFNLGNSKNTVAYTDGMMCSAAYWLGSQCNDVICSTSATIGSIGVYSSFLTYEKALKMEGIEPEVIQAGKYKTLGNPMKDLSDEERQVIQNDVDSCYSDFTAAIARKRTLDSETMQGQTFLGRDSVAVNLADGIEDELDDLISFLS